MIKGHTDIVLTDVNTGKTETVSDDNMVTNAIHDFMQPCGCINLGGFYSNSYVSSYQSGDTTVELMGGLLLFDKELEEDPDKYIVPGGARMTGNGCVGVISNDNVTELGSYNSEESGWQDSNTLKMVWDFSTSQANGEIGCACLTSRIHGFIGEGNSMSKRNKTDGSYNPYYGWGEGNAQSKKISGENVYPIGYENNVVYYIPSYYFSNHYESQNMKNQKKLTVYAAELPITKWDIRNSRYTVKTLSQVDIPLPDDFLAKYDTYGNELVDIYYRDGKTYILYKWESYWNASAKIMLLILSKDEKGNFSFSYKFLNAENTGIKPIEAVYREYYTTFIVGEYIVLLHPKASYKIKIDDISQIAELTNNAITNDGVVNWNYLYYRTDTTAYIYNQKVDVVLDEVNYLNVSSYNMTHKFNFINKLLVDKGDNGTPEIYAQRYNGYLATINNLDSPVTKTPDKTMKVIYTLTFDN